MVPHSVSIDAYAFSCQGEGLIRSKHRLSPYAPVSTRVMLVRAEGGLRCESSKRIQTGEAILSPLFPIQPIENAPVAAPRSGRARERKITHIYPNFLFLGLKGTPSFPPVI